MGEPFGAKFGKGFAGGLNIDSPSNLHYCPSMTKKKPLVSRLCTVCQKSFEVHQYRADTAKYCSKDCWSVRAGYRTCPACNTVFRPKSGGAVIYCSKRCSTRRSGDKSPAWRGGVTQNNKRARISDPLRQWRLSVFKRDNYTCTMCSQTNDLQAHHVKSFSTHPDLRLDVANGITVCIDCHGAIHGRNFRRSMHRFCSSCGKRLDPRTKGTECKVCILDRGESLSLQRRSPPSLQEQPRSQ